MDSATRQIDIGTPSITTCCVVTLESTSRHSSASSGSPLPPPDNHGGPQLEVNTLYAMWDTGSTRPTLPSRGTQRRGRFSVAKVRALLARAIGTAMPDISEQNLLRPPGCYDPNCASSPGTNRASCRVSMPQSPRQQNYPVAFCTRIAPSDLDTLPPPTILHTPWPRTGDFSTVTGGTNPPRTTDPRSHTSRCSNSVMQGCIRTTSLPLLSITRQRLVVIRVKQLGTPGPVPRTLRGAICARIEEGAEIISVTTTAAIALKEQFRRPSGDLTLERRIL
ncbi:hypothetical protein C8R46DRAFT_1039992 [Mycena filopes]|nr:hypothetical protein C8R46DRAFT_1039992 [Mycena filopes]